MSIETITFGGSVRSVNGTPPDSSGNVEVEAGGGGVTYECNGVNDNVTLTTFISTWLNANVGRNLYLSVKGTYGTNEASSLALAATDTRGGITLDFSECVFDLSLTTARFIMTCEGTARSPITIKNLKATITSTSGNSFCSSTSGSSPSTIIFDNCDISLTCTATNSTYRFVVVGANRTCRIFNSSIRVVASPTTSVQTGIIMSSATTVTEAKSKIEIENSLIEYTTTNGRLFDCMGNTEWVISDSEINLTKTGTANQILIGAYIGYTNQVVGKSPVFKSDNCVVNMNCSSAGWLYMFQLPNTANAVCNVDVNTCTFTSTTEGGTVEFTHWQSKVSAATIPNVCLSVRDSIIAMPTDEWWCGTLSFYNNTIAHAEIKVGPTTNPADDERITMIGNRLSTSAIIDAGDNNNPITYADTYEYWYMPRYANQFNWTIPLPTSTP